MAVHRTQIFHRLAFQLGLIASLVTALGLGSLGWTLARIQRTSLTEQLTAQVLAETRSLALAAAAPLLRHDPELGLHPLILRAEQEVDSFEEIVVLDNEGTIVGHRDLVRVGQTLSVEPPSSTLTVGLDPNARIWTVDGELMVACPVEHLGERVGRLIARVDRSGIDAAVADSVRQNLLIAAIAMLAVALLVVLLVARALRPLDALRAGVQRIGSGDLDTRVDVSSRNELGLLSQRINEMTVGLRRAQKDRIERERIEHELALAHELQTFLLPAGLPELRGFELAAHYSPALEVSGDYYDVIPIGRARVGLVAADVSGKGVPGLVVMAMVRIVMRQLALSGREPAEVLVGVDRLLRGSLRKGMFVTCCYGVLDIQEQSFTWTSAGHCPPVLFSDRTEPRELAAGGSPIGLLPESVFAAGLTQHHRGLEVGDSILLYTDGLTESMDLQRRALGEAPVMRCLQEQSRSDPDRVVRTLLRLVEEHRGEANATDDLTLIVARRTLADRSAPVGAASLPQPEVAR